MKDREIITNSADSGAKVVKNTKSVQGWKGLSTGAKVAIVSAVVFFALPVIFIIIFLIVFSFTSIYGGDQNQHMKPPITEQKAEKKLNILVNGPFIKEIGSGKLAENSAYDYSDHLFYSAGVYYPNPEKSYREMEREGVSIKLECGEGFTPKTPQVSSCEKKDSELEDIEGGKYFVINRSEFSKDVISLKFIAEKKGEPKPLIKEISVDNTKYLESEKHKAEITKRLLTLDKFKNQIKEGMTKAQINEVFAFDKFCEIFSQSGAYEIYSCTINSSELAVAGFTFENGVLVSKSQTGLR